MDVVHYDNEVLKELLAASLQSFTSCRRHFQSRLIENQDEDDDDDNGGGDSGGSWLVC